MTAKQILHISISMSFTGISVILLVCMSLFCSTVADFFKAYYCKRAINGTSDYFLLNGGMFVVATLVILLMSLFKITFSWYSLCMGTPKPNTAYGKSKLKAEQFLDSIGNDFNYIILRPTGVYGPREKDYYVMAKSIEQHVDFSVGYKRQDITFVYVKDVVQAVFLALDHGMSGRKYFLSDGDVYQSTTFSDYIHEELGSPWWIRIKAPVWVLRLVTLCGEYVGRLTGKMIVLNNDKFNILKQRNWRCNIEPACDELGYHPHYKLREGVKRTIKWYKENGWL